MRSRATKHALAWLIALASWLAASSATAESARIVVLPTSIGDHLDCNIQPADAKVADPAQVALAHRIDAFVTDAVEDAGMAPELRINLSGGAAAQGGCIEDSELRALAKSSRVIVPRILLRDGRMLLRIVLATPDSPILRLSTQDLDEKDLDFRVVVMVSELLATDTHKDTAVRPNATATPAPAAKPRSQGKAVVALSSMVLGGGLGYSLQRVGGGTNDARLTYPLIALGAGLGIGSSVIASEEWDLSLGDAWLLNAGMAWPVTSGLLLASSYNEPAERRYVYGMIGAGAGISLAAVAMNYREFTEGEALLTHSGGAGGLLLGGLIDWTIAGRTSATPYRGMGYGAGIGVVLAGAAATQLKVSSSRVLFIDLSVVLGGTLGAAAGSAIFLLKDYEVVPARNQRAWLTLIGGTAIVGGGIGWYLTRGWTAREHEGSGVANVWPYLSTASSPSDAVSAKPTGITAGVQGLF
jgi:hypothetical protein